MWDFLKSNWKKVLLGVGAGALVVAGAIFGSPVWVAAAIGAALGLFGLGFYSFLSGRKYTLSNYAAAALVGGIAAGLGLTVTMAFDATLSVAATNAISYGIFMGTPVLAPVALVGEGTPGPDFNERVLDAEAVRAAQLTRRGEELLRQRDSTDGLPPPPVPPSASRGIVDSLPGH